MPTKGITLGFIGGQRTDKRNAKALVTDLVDGKKVTLVFPVTQSHFTEPLQTLAELVGDSEWPYEVVTDATTKKMKEWQSFVSGAQKVHRAEDPVVGLVDLLAESPGPRLIIAWDGNKEGQGAAEEAMDRAEDQSVPCFSLINGLEPLEFNDEDADTDDEEDEDVDADSADEPDEDEDEDEDGDSDEGEEEPDEDDDAEPDEDEEEIEDDAEPDDEDSETEEDEESDEEGDEDEDGDDEEIEDDEDSESEEDEEEPEEEEEDVTTRRTTTAKAKSGTGQKKITERYLKSLEKDDLYALGKKYKVLPGRGRSTTTIIREILEVAEGTVVPTTATSSRQATGNRPAKPAAKKTTAKKAAVTKKPAAKTTTARRTTTAAKPTRTTTSAAKAPTASPKLLGTKQVRILGNALVRASDALGKAGDELLAALEN